MNQAPPLKSAFIEVRLDCEKWNLPDEFNEMLMKHIDCILTTVYLPWSPAMIPAKGDKIHMPAIVITLDTVVATCVCYHYTKDTGIVAYVETT